MKNKIAPGLCVISVLSGCTATNKYKGPNYTFDDLDHSTNILPKPIPINAEYTATQNCSEAHSVHSPLIWLPVVGPTIDQLLVPSPAELSWFDAWSILPLIGPPITYINGRQDCVHYNPAFADSSSTPKLETTIPPALVKEAITISDQNCYAYQHILTSGFNELDANQKFLSDAAAMTQTGRAFASPVAGAVIGGLKQVVTSANDAIKTSFFINYGAPRLFENIGTVRKVLIMELTTSSPPKWGVQSRRNVLRRLAAIHESL